MDCILFRHGIAVDREDWEGSEPERPLTTKGVERTEKAAAGLRRLAVIPTHILSSPFTRAHQTAKIVREQLHARAEVQLCDELLPDAPPDKVFPLLGSLPNDACVICVGHEPHLGEAAGMMVFGRPAVGLSLKKAGACLISYDAVPRAGYGALSWWLTPAQLRGFRKR